MEGSGYNTAAGLAYAGAALHVAALVLGGMGGNGTMMIAGAVLWFVIGAGLIRGMRWVAYLGFLLALVGVIAITNALFNVQWDAPQWVRLAIIAVDVLIALVLFGVLWRRPEPDRT